MFVVLKSSVEDIPKSENNNHIKWYHAARKRYEIVEVTQLSGRTLEEIKKEVPEAFEENLHNIVPVKYERVAVAFDKPDIEAPAKAIPVKPTEESKYKCSDCQLPSASIGGIRRHITKMHGKGKAQVIDIATGEILKEEEASIEEKFDVLPNSTASEEIKKIQEEVPEAENLKYKCEACGLKTPSLGGVRRHITKMHGKGACKVIDLATNLPLEEETENDDAPPAFQVADEKAKEVAPEAAPQAEVTFTRPKPVKRDFS